MRGWGSLGVLAGESLSTAVIPHGAVFAAGGGFHWAEDGLEEEAPDLAFAVEFQFARRREEWMAVKDDRLLSVAASDAFLQPEREVEFFAGEKL